MDDLERLCHAEDEFIEIFGEDSWHINDYNRWLAERYGVKFIPIPLEEASLREIENASFLEVLDPDRYLFFLLKWP